MSAGVLEPRNRVVVRQSVTKRTQLGYHFRMGIRPGQKTPTIQCVETNQMWHISWEQLIDLAIADGITVTPPQPEEDGDE